ncbi:hypothetical protein P692DRAFT_20138606 [Suillus brevipes Sb2]|nr:hypothetical protein P692DRAFT_20138606 [Suillus brevipes Sb2]
MCQPSSYYLRSFILHESQTTHFFVIVLTIITALAPSISVMGASWRWRFIFRNQFRSCSTCVSNSPNALTGSMMTITLVEITTRLN